MSADGSRPNVGPNPEPLQFDVVESATPGPGAPSRLTSPTCTACSASITTTYFEVNGAIICPACRTALETPPGSRLRRASAAVGLGALGALGGSLLYFAVAAITGREFGLVAIVVGFLVGKGVHKGSRGRGGWAYQTLAVSLTYLAIVSTYVPLVAKEFQHRASKDSLRAGPLAKPDTTPALAAPNELRASPSAAAARQPDTNFVVGQAGVPSAPAPVTQSAPTRVSAKHLGFGTIVLGVGALMLLAAIIPILAGFSNIIGLLIIGIAVFEAWKLNRRVVLQITGPYRVAGGAEGARAIA